MKLKILSSILFTIFLSTDSSAQSDIFQYAKDVFSFMSILDKNVETYFNKEDAKKLNRKFSYFETDLEDYLDKRKKLLDTLEKYNYKIKNKDWGEQEVQSLIRKFSKLTSRLYEIKNIAKHHFPDSIIVSLTRTLKLHASQQGYLSELEHFLLGQSVNLESLKKDGTDIYNELLKSLSLCRQTKRRLELKYNLTTN